MDDLHREQLNMPSDADFSVDDIVKEFGSAAESPPEEPAVEEEETLRIWTPKPKEKPPVEPVEEEALFEESEDEDEEEDEARPRLRIWNKPPAEARPPVYETAEDALCDYADRGRRLRLSAVLSWVLLAVSGAVTVIMANPGWGLDAFVSVPMANVVTLLILLVHSVLALPVLRKGVESLLKGRFTVLTMVCLTVLISAVRGFLTIGSEVQSLSAAASMVLTVSLWSEYLLCTAKLRTAKLVLAMEKPTAAVQLEGVWNDRPCLHRAEAELSGFVEDLEQPPGPEKTLGAACAVLSAAALAVAVVLNVRGGRDVLWVFNVLLLGTCPLGGVLAYGRAFCLASRRLKSVNAALRGWAGAKRLSGTAGVILTDTDIFPAANISLNGIRIFGDESADRLLGYASAILERSGATAVARLFEQALEAQNGRRYKLDNFRTYEAGGLGGEIGSDVILLGGLGFMQTMGVRIPDDARLKQALYISLGGRAAGVFALSYSPSDAVRSGLAALMGSRGLIPILATRDTLLTPSMVHGKYGLPADRLEYPVSRERAALAAIEGQGQQGAVLARGGFLSFAMAVCTARRLRRSVPAAVTASLLGAVIGFFLMCLLTLVGAYDTAGAMNLMVYHAIWLVPAGLISGMVGKS